MLMINYTPVGLPSTLVESSKSNTLRCSWSDLVWAAATVGRRYLPHSIQPHTYAYIELIYRSTLLYTHLQAADYRPGLWETADTRLQQSSTYQNLGPTEKSAVSYFFGLTTARLFSERLLQLPWLLHFDTYSQNINTDVSWKLPDLIGLNKKLDWIIIEAKGRSNGLGWEVVKRTNKLVRTLTRIGGVSPQLRVGFFCYFTSIAKTLKVYLATPSMEDQFANGEELDITAETFFTNTYSLPLALLNTTYGDTPTSTTYGNRTYRVKAIPEVDIHFGLDEKIYELLQSKEVDMPQKLAAIVSDESFLPQTTTNNITVGSDGIYVKLGPSWNDDKMNLVPADRPL